MTGYLRKQMNKWKDKMQLLHSAQEPSNSVLETKWHEVKTSQENLKSQLQQTKARNCILEMNCHDLIARHENLKMQVQKRRLDIQNITTSHQKTLKERKIQNGTGYPSLEPNHVGCSNLHSFFAERKWLIEPQVYFLTRNTGSSEIISKSDVFQTPKTPTEGIVPLTNNSPNIKPETNRDHFSKGIKFRTSHCSTASERHLNAKWIEEKEELQQLIIGLKKKLSLQVQPGYPTEELLLSAEHLCKSFSNLITQVASPARKTEVGGNSISGLSDLPS